MTPDAFQDLVRPYHRELAAYCYRMLGSVADAEDQVQETLLAAWRGIDGFEGRASVRTWLYRIATNGCIDAIRRRPRRGMPVDLADAPIDPRGAFPAEDREVVWVEPAPAAMWKDAPVSPEAEVTARESVQLAFVVALQRLPAVPRAALILREVLGWSAAEVAALLDSTVAAVNSALQRARAALEAARAGRSEAADPAVVARYIDAWHRRDLDALVGLLRDDVLVSMPPSPAWLRGREAFRVFIEPRLAPVGDARVVRLEAADELVFASYRRGADRVLRAYGVHLLRVEGGAITELHAFLDPSLPARLGAPVQIDR